MAIVEVVQPPEPPKTYKIVEIPEVKFIYPEWLIDRSGTNTYPSYPYQCTRYAKDKRPDLPNQLGNADGWYQYLKAQGWPVGEEPLVGAIAQSRRGMHVAYVERVEGDLVYLSERNYDYRGSYRERWAHASDFVYIY